MINWEIKNGYILADGEIQDSAIYIWSLEYGKEDDLFANKNLIVDERRLPVLKRLGFGDMEKRTKELNILKGKFNTRIQLASNRIPCIPDEFKKEIKEWLHKSKEDELLNYLYSGEQS